LRAEREDAAEVDHEPAAAEEREAALARIRETADADAAERVGSERADGDRPAKRRHREADEPTGDRVAAERAARSDDRRACLDAVTRAELETTAVRAAFPHREDERRRDADLQ